MNGAMTVRARTKLKSRAMKKTQKNTSPSDQTGKVRIREPNNENTKLMTAVKEKAYAALFQKSEFLERTASEMCF